MIDFSQTYLYKLHRLTNSLDRIFNNVLLNKASIGLAQLSLLLAVEHNSRASQSAVSKFLVLTPGAVSRQVELAQKSGWLKVVRSRKDRRQQILKLTEAGRQVVQRGLQVVDRDLALIFTDENLQIGLMRHIDLLQKHIEDVPMK